VTGILEGKIAIVTGAGKGLGRAIAEAFDAEGATVVVADIDETAAKDVAASLTRGEAVACDVRDEAAVEALVAGTVARHGGLDIAVANAGVGIVAPIATTDLAAWRQVTSINLDGVFLTVRHCALAMAASGGGSIITMASITGFGGAALVASYAAAKAATINLTKTAALEFRAHGVRVNAVCPGFVDTDLVRDNREQFDTMLGIDLYAAIDHAQGRMGQVGDVAPLFVWLASDRSRFSTASTFVVDGGAAPSLV
jgi:NAD(P)-dependent dehydrogenase (short-subunit alcohol dehydrogenase family)